MTRKDFEKLRAEIESQRFQSVELDPISYAIARLHFEKKKYQTLIDAAASVDMKTTRAKAARLKRKMDRADISIARFEKLKKERAVPVYQNFLTRTSPLAA